MRILIAPDSFKDCLSAREVAEALSAGIRKGMPAASVRIVPMADGGEGTVDSLIDATGGERVRMQARDPLLRRIPVHYGITGNGTTAVIEMAAASGLERLSPGERDPRVTSTAGTGDMIRHALDRGCRKVLLGIGGSATNDGGMGMASALGVRFLDETGQRVPEGGAALDSVRAIDLSGLDPRIAETEIRVACDVDNPLTGPLGASAVYGPQKGAGPEQVRLLDRGMVRFAGLIKAQTGKEVDQVPGAGAAGGLGAGLVAFLGARLVKGFEMVAAEVSLEEAIRWADLVITGEGRMDGQTRYGKTPFGVAQLAGKSATPVIAVAGSVGEGTRTLHELGFRAVLPIQEGPMTLEESMRQASQLLERTGERIARILSIRRPD